MMRFILLLISVSLTLTGCGLETLATAVALNKFQCEAQGKYWDLEKGCLEQDGDTTTDTTGDTTTDTTGDTTTTEETII